MDATTGGAFDNGDRGSGKDDDRSGNSTLLMEVEADLGFPVLSTSLPNTATPQELRIGFSQGRASMSATTSITVGVELASL